MLDTVGLEFKTFHLPGPWLFLKKGSRTERKIVPSFLPEHLWSEVSCWFEEPFCLFSLQRFGIWGRKEG